MTRERLCIGLMVVMLILTRIGWAVSGSADSTQSSEKFLNTWLMPGPIEMPLPAFHDVSGKKFSPEDLLEFDALDVAEFQPRQGAVFQWNSARKLRWVSQQVDSGKILFSVNNTSGLPQVNYLATFLDASRWTPLKLNVKSPQLFRIFLDGVAIASSTEKDDPAPQIGSVSKEIKLETGKHLLVIKTLYRPEDESGWTVQSSLQIPETFGVEAVSAGISPEHHMNIRHLLDEPRVSGVSVSPNGELAMLTIHRAGPDAESSEQWIEIRSVKNGELVETYRGGMKISDVKWSPAGRRLAFTSSKKEKTSLWIVDLEERTTRPLLEKVENFSGYTWSPDGTFMVYSVTDTAEESERLVKRLQGLRDRRPWWRDRSFLYQVNVPQGTRRRLTAGKLTTHLMGISPDGEKILFTRDIEDYSERPYGKTELYLLDLHNLQAQRLWTGKWFSSARWSPDGKQLLLVGGPSMFGELGQNVPPEKIPNEYDEQAYLMEISSGKVTTLTRTFEPAIREAFWHEDDVIYFSTTDHSYRRLYRFDLKNRQFSLLPTGLDVLNEVAIARDKPVAVYTGSDAATPRKAFSMDLQKKQFQLLSFPAADDFQNVEFGKVEPWQFTNERGVPIEGRIYYPPDFDSDRTYPCIVYYYGGTNPVGRDFGGRYPKNLWAAQGYVVYVLQPSGAVGFGQAFSALHVNDWGKIVSDEIILGVQKFLDAHPFVDKKRVAGIGASYGGFMTMLLVTKTDLFAAAVAHAGISSISSYWGEGYWGFQYSGVATANSFPWNRPDIYVEQSPLFSADKISTPLLLLHGANDTNVPPGESIQLYTALKLLGKEVELVQVDGSNHLIMEYEKRKIWTKTIMAWFDRWLKDQPQWWDELYPAD